VAKMSRASTSKPAGRRAVNRGRPVPGMTRQPADALGPRANRTIARIMDATREVFLTRGYAGTTIDEIAKLAGVSRASFYTYFPSKRDVLLAVGAHSASEALGASKRLRDIEPSVDALTGWVADYFDLLDVHGAFAFAWTQAAQDDEEIRTAGMRTHLEVCRRLGEALGVHGRVDIDEPTVLGLLASSMLERGWDYCRLYSDAIDRAAMQRQIARTLWGAVRPVPASVRGNGRSALRSG
jgi:AcrR family transcriptional regulator